MIKKAEMKTVSDTVVSLKNGYLEDLKQLANRLSPYLPDNAILAVDCVPKNGSLNAFHYVDGKDDVEVLLSLQNQNGEIKKMLLQTHRFHINYEAGLNVGLWTQLDFFNYEKQINWDEAFVVKKATGEMRIYNPILNSQRAEGKISVYELKSRGVSTRVSIIKFLHQPGANFYQKYHEPLCGPQDTYRIATYRLFLFLEKGMDAKFLGGLWTSTKDNTLRLKGSKDIRIGLIRV